MKIEVIGAEVNNQVGYTIYWFNVNAAEKLKYVNVVLGVVERLDGECFIVDDSRVQANPQSFCSMLLDILPTYVTDDIRQAVECGDIDSSGIPKEKTNFF
ncbi:hypothetical protein ABT56_19205 [Photobacterium aquae]|uniref:Uncharacterized protein n=1 Tax=Photobacterium aquae TaxID=1195763 RepID=A0A0J1JN04_9GAMM|nr:hypothetical protein [Photobacterium aquae]KLV03557.1 hypothetical protein ABT56_19205 [Photobacterium aquae]